MGLPWIRLDTSLPDNPKILDLLCEENGNAAAFVYICSMAYSGKHGTDGFIPRSAIGRINGDMQLAKLLIAGRLWDEQPGGWQIHGWDEFQVSDGVTYARRKRAQAAAAVRWGK